MTQHLETLRARIATELTRSRARSAVLTDALDDEDLVRQHSPLMSPLVWDLAHIGNQEELWLVRDVGGREPVRQDIDELYDAIFVRPAMGIGRFFWRTGDQRIIDGLGPDGISARVLDVTRGVVRVQTGYLYHYAFAMLIGVAALVTFYLFRGAQ